MNVVLDPPQCSDDISQRIVARSAFRRLRRKRRMGQKAKQTEAIVDRYNDDAAARERFSPEDRQRPGARSVSATVYPDHHWLRAANRTVGEDVEVEAILAQSGFRRIAHARQNEIPRNADLRARCPEAVANSPPAPRLHRLWCSPAEVGNGRFGIGDAQIRLVRTAFDPDNFAIGDARRLGEVVVPLEEHRSNRRRAIRSLHQAVAQAFEAPDHRRHRHRSSSLRSRLPGPRPVVPIVDQLRRAARLGSISPFKTPPPGGPDRTHLLRKERLLLIFEFNDPRGAPHSPSAEEAAQ